MAFTEDQRPTVGQRVITIRLLGTGNPQSLLVHNNLLTGRKGAKPGIVKQVVPGSDFEGWIVDHDDGDQAAYFYDELAPYSG